MKDKRSPLEKQLDTLIGPPLYYCSECLRAVKVQSVAGEGPLITRPCTEGECETAEILAPRKAIATGEGGMNFKDSTKLAYWQIASFLTGRCV